MPTKNSEDGEIIHFSELETILTIVANNPEKIGSRTCMRSGALKSVDKELAHMKFRCGIIMTPSDRLFIFSYGMHLEKDWTTLRSQRIFQKH